MPMLMLSPALLSPLIPVGMVTVIWVEVAVLAAAVWFEKTTELFVRVLPSNPVPVIVMSLPTTWEAGLIRVMVGGGVAAGGPISRLCAALGPTGVRTTTGTDSVWPGLVGAPGMPAGTV